MHGDSCLLSCQLAWEQWKELLNMQLVWIFAKVHLQSLQYIQILVEYKICGGEETFDYKMKIWKIIAAGAAIGKFLIKVGTGVIVFILSQEDEEILNMSQAE